MRCIKAGVRSRTCDFAGEGDIVETMWHRVLPGSQKSNRPRNEPDAVFYAEKSFFLCADHQS